MSDPSLSDPSVITCPINTESTAQRIVLAHGEGAKLARQLITRLVQPMFDNSLLSPLGDSAYLPPVNDRLAISTDSYVVSPLFFPGGDIGSLAVTGTLNDLAVAGAQPLWLTLSLIIEEGLELETLQRVLSSAAKAAKLAGVAVVSGDTKVVPHSAADKLFINTTGIGRVHPQIQSDVSKLAVGDQLIVSGPIAQHGMAVLSARESFGFAGDIQSDCGLLYPAVQALAQSGVTVKCMRDATRGGVAAVLHEWADSSGLSMVIQQSEIPVLPTVRGMCELLGMDPLFVANEGTMLVAVAAQQAQAALQALRAVPISDHACIIGEVQPKDISPVSVIRTLGRLIPLDQPTGALLPRIC